MLTQDRLGTGKVRSLDPDLGLEARNIADAGVQVVAEHLTANALFLERLLPDVGLKRICGCGKANNVVLIFRIHGIPLLQQVTLRFGKTAGRLPGINRLWSPSVLLSAPDCFFRPPAWRRAIPVVAQQGCSVPD